MQHKNYQGYPFGSHVYSTIIIKTIFQLNTWFSSLKWSAANNIWFVNYLSKIHSNQISIKSVSNYLHFYLNNNLNNSGKLKIEMFYNGSPIIIYYHHTIRSFLSSRESYPDNFLSIDQTVKKEAAFQVSEKTRVWGFASLRSNNVNYIR